MKLYLKTLTPVHIGTGKEVEKFEYIIKNNQFCRINFSKLSELLFDKFPEKFSEWINKISSEENVTNELNIDNIKRQISGNTKIDLEINKSIQYKLNSNGKPNNKVRECIKSGSNELFIPGSSIKGSIRTAFLSNALTRTDESFKSKLIDNITSQIQTAQRIPRDREKIKKSICDFVESEIFYCGVKTTKNGIESENFNDEKFDLMKLISISDSSSLKSEEYGEICNMTMYKLRNTRGRTLINSECISKYSLFNIDISIDKNFILKAKELLEKKDDNFGKKDWIKFKEKFERLFNLNLIALNSNNIESLLLDSILNSINKFGKEVYDREGMWINSLNGNVDSQYIKNFYSNPEFLNSFKVGYGSGFSAATIFLWMNNVNNLRLQIEKVAKFFGIGKHRNGTDVNITEFPFTRKYDINNNEISPLGWIEISRKEFPIPTTENTININVEKPKIVKKDGWVEAELVQISKKPYKIKILEGDLKDFELNFQYGNLEGLKVGKRLYVTITVNKKQRLDSKPDFMGFIEE